MNQRNKWLEKIGRTGLKTVKFDVGNGGGKPIFDQLDFAHALAGLGNEATAWAMYAYSNTEDEKSLNFLTARLAKIITRQHPKIPTKSIVGLVKITLREVLMYSPGEEKRNGVQATVKCRAMGMPRRTYYRHRSAIESATETLLSIIYEWEAQISNNVASKLTD